MDDVGHPTQFLNGLKHTTGKEDGTLTVVGIVIAIGILCHLALGEVVVIVDEIDLNARLDNSSHLDNQWVISIVNDKIHPREPDDLMQLSTTLVDGTPLRHERPNLMSSVEHRLWKSLTHDRQFAVGNIGNYLLIDE